MVWIEDGQSYLGRLATISIESDEVLNGGSSRRGVTDATVGPSFNGDAMIHILITHSPTTGIHHI